MSKKSDEKTSIELFAAIGYTKIVEDLPGDTFESFELKQSTRTILHLFEDGSVSKHICDLKKNLWSASELITRDELSAIQQWQKEHKV